MRNRKMSQKSDKLYALAKESALLGGILGELGWNQETYLPEGAHENRANQIELLSGIRHKLRTGEEFKKALSEKIDIKTGKLKGKPKPDDAINYKLMREDFLKDTALPVEFVQEFAKLSSTATEVWKKARKENNFKLFLPYLTKIVEMNKKKAELLGYKDHPYDALLDLYEPNMKTKEVDALFEPLKKELKEILKKQKTKPVKLPFKEYPQEQQLELSRLLLEKLPYDFKKGRLDISTHPFSSAQHPTDSRITTRIDLKDPLSNLLTTLHEAGHALYEMGLEPKWFGTPRGEAISLGFHESQSRWWETRIGLSKAFWEGFTPVLHKQGILKSVPSEKIYAYINYIQPSFIRVESDEMTYPLHVILRFEIEKALISGKLKPKDVPEKWNALMKELLGVTPPTDTLGCLQDVHWSIGAMGYFPTYLLGNLIAAQLFETFVKAHPDWEKRVKKLDFAFITEWLKKNIHTHGRKYSTLELVKKISGKPFTSDAFVKYLREKHL